MTPYVGTFVQHAQDFHGIVARDAKYQQMARMLDSLGGAADTIPAVHQMK